MSKTATAPQYVKALLKPVSTAQDKKAWSISLDNVWLPFFTATNTTGATEIPKDALGAPLRLSRDKDGTPKFNKSGRPVMRIAPELNAQIKTVRENFTGSLVAFAEKVMKENPEEYRAEVSACHKAGKPIIEQANEDIQAVIDAELEAAQAEAERLMTEGAAEIVPEQETVPVG